MYKSALVTMMVIMQIQYFVSINHVYGNLVTSVCLKIYFDQLIYVCLHGKTKLINEG